MSVLSIFTSIISFKMFLVSAVGILEYILEFDVYLSVHRSISVEKKTS